MLSTRELAVAIWFGVALFWMAGNPRIRGSFGALVRAATNRLILVSTAALAIWIAGSVGLLQAMKMWETTELKSTLIWATTFGFVALMNLGRVVDDRAYFRNSARQILSATAVTQFIADAYTFHVVVEVLLVPVIFILVLLQTFSARRSDLRAAETFANVGLALVVFGVLLRGAYGIGQEFGKFASWQSLREFLVPIWLSLLLLPFTYVLALISEYQSAFNRLNVFMKDASLRWQTKLLLVFWLPLSVRSVHHWTLDFMSARPSTRAQVLYSIAMIKRARRVQKAPFVVAPQDGWSPNDACKILSDQGLEVARYSRSYESEWGGSANMLALDDGLLPNNLAFYIEGHERAVKVLKLRVNVNRPDRGEEAQARFEAVAKILIDRVVTNAEQGIASGVVSCSDGAAFRDLYRIATKTMNYRGGVPGGYDKTLTISAPGGREPARERDLIALIPLAPLRPDWTGSQ